MTHFSNKKRLANELEVELIDAIKLAAAKDRKNVNQWLRKVLWIAVADEMIN